MADHRPLEDFDRALVVTAHPDDVDFGIAGTVALLTEAGVQVSYCIVTDGQAGGFDRATPREEIPAIRRAEQTAAAEAVGVSDVRFLGRVDGEVVNDLALARDLSREIRRVRPDLVLTSSPERNYRFVGASHPDHRRVGDATLDAVYPFARNPFAFPELLEDEGLDAWIVGEVWLLGAPDPDRFLDITDVAERKFAAIEAHASQVADPAALRERVTDWLVRTASVAGFPDGRLAEAVKVVRVER